jgi:GntR family transcriptional regulator
MQALPRYQHIINYYRTLIESGKLTEGSKIPTEEEMCDHFNVSRITIRRALDGLMQEGYIYKQQGKGSFVTTKRTDIQLNHLQGFNQEMRALGFDPSTKLISMELIAPSEIVAASLVISSTQKVYVITRLRCADGMPMAIEKVHMPFSRFAGIEHEDFTQSLYEILRQKFGCEFIKAEQSIKASCATESDSELLEIKLGKPVLLINRVTYDQTGKPFEFVQSTYRGDKYQFNVTIEK